MGVSIHEAVQQLQAVLDECFIYVDKPWTYFTDNKPDAGFIGLLNTISVAEASRKIAGTSIASHAHHVRFSLIESASWIRGDHSERDWAESWKVNDVNEDEWSKMRHEILKAYEDLREAIGSHASGNAEAFGGAAGVVAHMAFHLGAIRQKAAVVRE
ncbi:MAG TPA: hypothetical protein VLH08_20910 [Acidobacteriota bacterium]|nr:hypothetical protein [Acidobacteriota bacterium]